LSELDLPLARQLLRSATSVAANYSSATRGRSEAEFYSKICIVVEECDEALYWLTFLSDVDVFRREQVNVIMSEASELLRIFSSIRRKLRDKRRPPS
jgi:four helix bundle protein